MFKRIYKRKWLVDVSKIENLEQYKYEKIETAYLSQRYDSLCVYISSINGEDLKLNLKDSGKKVRNLISYNISEDEYFISSKLAGNKIVKKKRYYIPSSFDKNNIISLDIFDDYGFIIAEFESDNEIVVDILPEEEWFIKDVTNDEKFYGHEFIYN